MSASRYIKKAFSGYKVLAYPSLVYLGYKVYVFNKNKHGEHPCVKEAVRLLSSDKRVAEMIGEPIELTKVAKATIMSKQQWCNMNFTVSGPAGSLQVGMIGESRNHRQLIDTLVEVAKGNLNEEELKLQGDSPQDFYIPSNEIREDYSNKNLDGRDLKKEDIDPDCQFWRISSLYAKVDDDLALILISNEKKDLVEKLPKFENPMHLSDLDEILKVVSLSKVEGLEDFESDRVGLTMDDLTEEEKEEELEKRRKRKQRSLGQNVLKVRLLSIGVIILGIGGFWMWSKNANKFVAIGNSVLHQRSNFLVSQNEAIQRKFGNFKLMSNVRGNMTETSADFNYEIKGDKVSGWVEVGGTRDEDSKEWKFTKLDVVAENDGKKQKMNLLK
mmetsp:Transcript_28231/g.32355  ORF Transcript_28231/g.32355 Transcript_28231/m.32355 type:complete len:386 (+) Transcript_28231:66-1223(+)